MSDEVSASVEKIIDSGLVVPEVIAKVRFSGPEAPLVGQAWLAPAGTPLCQGGLRAVAIRPDEWLADQSVRELVFPREAVDRSVLMTTIPTVLDIETLPSQLTGTRRCLRIPLARADARPEWVAPARWFLGAGLRFSGPVGGAQSDVGGGFLMDLHGGFWLGAARLRLDGIFGEAGTQRSPPVGYSRPVAELLGGAVSAELFPVRVGRFGVGFGAGYEWLFTDFHADRGASAWDEYHTGGPRGPRAMLRLARVPAAPSWPGFANQRDGWVRSVDFFVARWSGVGSLAATFVGLGVSADAGYW